MMKHLLAGSAVLVACMIAMASTAEAQSNAKASVRINVPFEFVVGDLALPAGSYKIETPLGARSITDRIGVLTLRNMEGRVYHAVVTDVAQRESRSEAKLIFTMAHGRHFLSEVWEAGRTVGLKLRTPEAGIQLAQGEQSEVVALMF
jgi:siroheme synthase